MDNEIAQLKLLLELQEEKIKNIHTIAQYNKRDVVYNRTDIKDLTDRLREIEQVSTPVVQNVETINKIEAGEGLTIKASNGLWTFLGGIITAAGTAWAVWLKFLKD